MTLGQLLRQARLDSGHGLNQAARLAKISGPYLSKVETGDQPRPPSESVLRRLAQLYEVSPYPFYRAAGRIPDRIKQRILDDPTLITLIDYLDGHQLSGERVEGILEESIRNWKVR